MSNRNITIASFLLVPLVVAAWIAGCGGGGGGGGGGSSMTFASINPPTGTQTGGTLVTITGTNFANISQVTFGGAPLQGLTNPNSTTITGSTSNHAVGAVAISIFSTTN